MTLFHTFSLPICLIDSIVNFSINYAPLALVSETPRCSMYPDNEPLFRASDDEDEDEDDGHARPHDIENPPPRRRSVSPPSARSIGERKSVSSGTATAIPSGSTTPVTKPIDTNVTAHAYPPSTIAGSPNSASSSLSSTSFSRSRKRAPPPLALKAQDASHPNIEISRSAPPEEDAMPNDDEKWAAWGDEDDWAERVGEDEWTGRRLETRKEAIDDVWRDHSSPNPHSIPVS